MGELAIDQQPLVYRRLPYDSRRRFQLLRLDDRTLDSAADLTQHHPLRGYDAVHLASALLLRDILLATNLPAPIFICADANLCAVANMEGLAVENPNDHS